VTAEQTVQASSSTLVADLEGVCQDLVEMDPAEGNLLMRASGLLEETRELFGRDDIDVFPAQLLKRQVSQSAIEEAVPL